MHLLKRYSATAAALFITGLCARATVLSTVDQVMPMIHINLDYNEYDYTFSVHVDSGIPEMKPLSILSPGDSFNPDDPWYTTLDPSQDGDAWTRRYGFVNTGDPLPLGEYFWIDMDIALAGLEAYYYRAEPATFDPMFGTDGSNTLWQYPSAMYHPAFVAPATVASYSATGLVYIGDASGNPLSESQSFTLNFTAVPEPETYGLLIGGLALGICWYLRKRRA